MPLSSRAKRGICSSPIRSIAALALCLGAASARAVAQSEPRSGYTGFFASGVSHIATRELDDRLAANGHPTFGSGPVAFNVGAYRRFRSGMMVGGEWHFMPVGSGTFQGRDVGLGAGYATVGFGYSFDTSPRVRLYPRLGLGVGGMGLWSEDATRTGGVGFDQWQSNPEADPAFTTLSQGSMVVDLGGGAELLLRRHRRGPLVGMRLGYIATAFDQGWTRDGQAVSGAPSATVAGPYARLLIGWRRE